MVAEWTPYSYELLPAFTYAGATAFKYVASNKLIRDIKEIKYDDFGITWFNQLRGHEQLSKGFMLTGGK